MIYAIQCNWSKKLGILIAQDVGGHIISYNEYGVRLKCGFDYYKAGHLIKNYTLLCKLDNTKLFKDMQDCPENIKQLITLYGTKIA